MRFSTELPEWAKDAVYTETEFHFSFGDRVKILFGWLPNYSSGVATEVPPGRTAVISERIFYRRPGWWLWKPKFVGYVAVSDGPAEEGR